MAEVKPMVESFAKIKVVGVGGSGGSALNRMIESGIKGVEFIAINTDVQALHYNKASKKIHIGKTITKGLGAGMNPELGRAAAEEAQNEIRDSLKDANMVFITCGLGGGTGTGAAPVVAELARDIGALTVAVVTKPFSFEGGQRKQIAERGMADISDKVDTIIAIPNDKILQVIEKKTSILDAFMVVDEVLRQGVQGISEIITVPQSINLDFKDVSAVMSGSGTALMGIGQASGENRAIEAAKMAINSPLLETSIEGARGILFIVVGGNDLSMHEVSEAAKVITSSADEDAKVIFGVMIDPKYKDEVKITVVATGFNGKRPVGTSSTIDQVPQRSYSPTPFIEEDQNKVSPPPPKSKPSALKMAQSEPANKKPSAEEEEDDELSIPTFIRKKMM